MLSKKSFMRMLRYELNISRDDVEEKGLKLPNEEELVYKMNVEKVNEDNGNYHFRIKPL
jgi:hypothetical protein